MHNYIRLIDIRDNIVKSGQPVIEPYQQKSLIFLVNFELVNYLRNHHTINVTLNVKLWLYDSVVVKRF